MANYKIDESSKFEADLAEVQGKDIKYRLVIDLGNGKQRRAFSCWVALFRVRTEILCCCSRGGVSGRVGFWSWIILSQRCLKFSMLQFPLEPGNLLF